MELLAEDVHIEVGDVAKLTNLSNCQCLMPYPTSSVKHQTLNVFNTTEVEQKYSEGKMTCHHPHNHSIE